MVGSDCSTGLPSVSHPATNYGVTKPISLAGPTDADIHRNIELEKVVFKFQLFWWVSLLLCCVKISVNELNSIFCYVVRIGSSWLTRGFTKVKKKLLKEKKFWAALTRWRHCSPVFLFLLIYGNFELCSQSYFEKNCVLIGNANEILVFSFYY